MDVASAVSERIWTVEEYMRADHSAFGSAWRYELVDGQIVAQDAPTRAHAVISANLVLAIGNRLRGNPDGCRAEVGPGVSPAGKRRNTARIPDVMVRCGRQPRVIVEVVSHSELRDWRRRDRKRRDLQQVEGVAEIVEVYQRETAVHVYRRAADDAWTFEALDDESSTLRLRSLGIEVPFAEIYEGVDFDEADEPTPSG